MGTCIFYGSVYDDAYLRSLRSKFSALWLTERDVKSLLKVFEKYETKDTGTLSLDDLFTRFEVENNKFLTRTYSCYMEVPKRKVTFGDFVLHMWNFCSLSQIELVDFAFDIYKYQEGNFLPPTVLNDMIHDIYKDADSHPHLKRLMTDFKKINIEDPLNLSFLHKFSFDHPVLFHPIVSAQKILRGKIIGTSFWRKVSKTRVQLSFKKYLSLEEILSQGGVTLPKLKSNEPGEVPNYASNHQNKSHVNLNHAIISGTTQDLYQHIISSQSKAKLVLVSPRTEENIIEMSSQDNTNNNIIKEGLRKNLKKGYSDNKFPNYLSPRSALASPRSESAISPNNSTVLSPRAKGAFTSSDNIDLHKKSRIENYIETAQISSDILNKPINANRKVTKPKIVPN